MEAHARGIQGSCAISRPGGVPPVHLPASCSERRNNRPKRYASRRPDDLCFQWIPIFVSPSPPPVASIRPGSLCRHPLEQLSVFESQRKAAYRRVKVSGRGGGITGYPAHGGQGKGKIGLTRSPVVVRTRVICHHSGGVRILQWQTACPFLSLPSTTPQTWIPGKDL